jgi:hypothetical protein
MHMRRLMLLPAHVVEETTMVVQAIEKRTEGKDGSTDT